MATWSDNFDSYALGSINGQGGWTGWDNIPAAAGTVTNELSRSSPQSQLIELGHDSVHTYTGYTSGAWTYTAYQYIPGNMVGNSYYIMLSNYVIGGAGNVWTVQLDFNSTTKTIVGDCGASNNVTMPYTPDRWAEIKVEIYLDPYPIGDWTKVYYNGTLFDSAALPDHPTLGGGYRWTKGVFGSDNGPLAIGCVDLFANAATKVYYDDMSLVPEPASCLLLLAAAGLLRRR
jgi:hypothetical protein